MKKFVTLIILILPIFLLVAVSVAGIVLSLIVSIKVESVMFINESERRIVNLKIARDEEFELMYRVLPVQATNKSVSFATLRPEVVSVTEDGIICGLDYGFSTIIINTLDGRKTAQLLVEVTDEYVSSVELSLHESTLSVLDSIDLVATVLPTTAVNKDLSWSSSDDMIATVDQTGRVTAVGVGEAVITVETVDGGKTDECRITVTNDKPTLAFKRLSFEISENSIDLKEEIIFNEDVVSFESIKFTIESGSSHASINADKILTFSTPSKRVIVVATVPGTLFKTEMYCIWEPA